MKYSGIGGQAVMEGVMMKNGDTYAVAVRKPDQEIVVEVSEYSGIIKNKKIRNMPILRGVFSFIESLVLGMKTLTYSASFFEEEEKTEEKEQADSKQDGILTGVTVAFSVILAVGIFMVLPYGISLLFQRFISSHMLLALLEGVIRLIIFVGYVALISLMPDIKTRPVCHILYGCHTLCHVSKV